MRLHLPRRAACSRGVAQAIAETQAILGAIDLVRVEGDQMVRDVTVACADSDHAESVVRRCARSRGCTSTASPTARS